MFRVRVSNSLLPIQCKDGTTPFRLNRPHPPPPSLQRYKEPPVPGTEKTLKKAMKKTRQDLPEEQERRKREVPWVLDAEFASDEDLWVFLDGLDLKELRRQRVKFDLPNYQHEEDLKKALFLFVKHQEVYQQEADQTMERRIITANEKSQRREHNRRSKLQKNETSRAKSDQGIDPFDPNIDPFHGDTSLSWIVENRIQPLGE